MTTPNPDITYEWSDIPPHMTLAEYRRARPKARKSWFRRALHRRVRDAHVTA
jgi:hypothetical protein